MNYYKLFLMFSFVQFFIHSIDAKPSNPSKLSKVERQEVKYKYSSFKEAEKEKNYLKFVGSSTKFKLFTTSFEGYAKEFSFSFDKNEMTLTNVEISIVANQIDTDNDTRNDKMYQKCLVVEKYPRITAKIPKAFILKDGEVAETDVILTIKDKDLSRKLKYTTKENQGIFEIHFNTDFSFLEAGIEDPSIAIAKVSELFLIEGTIQLKK